MQRKLFLSFDLFMLLRLNLKQNILVFIMEWIILARFVSTKLEQIFYYRYVPNLLNSLIINFF